MNHVLKCHPAYFDRVWAGDKTFEIRADDREPRFAEGDRVYLVEWDPAAGRELPRYLTSVITCIVRGPAYGLAEGHCVLGLDPFITSFFGLWSQSRTAAGLKEQSRTPGKGVA